MHCNNFGSIELVLFICVHSGKEIKWEEINPTIMRRWSKWEKSRQLRKWNLTRLMQKKRLPKLVQYCLRNHLLINKAAAVTRSEKQSGSLVASASQCSSSVAKGCNEEEKTSARKKMSTSSSGEATRVATTSSAKCSAEDDSLSSIQANKS